MRVRFINFAILSLMFIAPGMAMDGTKAKNDSRQAGHYNTEKGVLVKQFSKQDDAFWLPPELADRINEKGIRLEAFPVRCPTAAEVQQTLDEHQNGNWEEISLSLPNTPIQFTTTTSERGSVQFKGVYMDSKINCIYELFPLNRQVIFTASKNGKTLESEKCHGINENYRVEGEEDPTGWASLYYFDTYIAQNPEDLGMMCHP